MTPGIHRVLQRSTERTSTIHSGGFVYKEELYICIEAVNTNGGAPVPVEGGPGGGQIKAFGN